MPSEAPHPTIALFPAPPISRGVKIRPAVSKATILPRKNFVPPPPPPDIDLADWNGSTGGKTFLLGRQIFADIETNPRNACALGPQVPSPTFNPKLPEALPLLPLPPFPLGNIQARPPAQRRPHR